MVDYEKVTYRCGECHNVVRTKRQGGPRVSIPSIFIEHNRVDGDGREVHCDGSGKPATVRA